MCCLPACPHHTRLTFFAYASPTCPLFSPLLPPLCIGLSACHFVRQVRKVLRHVQPEGALPRDPRNLLILLPMVVGPTRVFAFSRIILPQQTSLAVWGVRFRIMEYTKEERRKGGRRERQNGGTVERRNVLRESHERSQVTRGREGSAEKKESRVARKRCNSNVPII